MVGKREILKIKELKIKVRGQAVKNALSCIEAAEGENGIKKLKKELKKFNCWAKEYDDLKTIEIFKWYPLWYDAVPIILAIELFNWQEEKIKNFGRCSQKVSFFEKTLLKYFVSIEQVLKLVPERWKNHYSQGELETKDFNIKKKYAVVRLRDFSVHPNLCLRLSGYFESAASFVIADKNPKSKIQVKETKCTFKGDNCHEFLIKWN